MQLCEMEVKLVKLMMSVSATGGTISVYEWCGEEKSSVYKVQLSAKYGDKIGSIYDRTTRMIKKALLMKIDSMFVESAFRMNYHIWCLPQDVETAKAKLIAHSAATVAAMKKSVDAMYDSVHSHIIVITEK